MWPGRGGLAARRRLSRGLRRWCGGADSQHASPDGRQGSSPPCSVGVLPGPSHRRETRRRGGASGNAAVVMPHNDPPPLGETDPDFSPVVCSGGARPRRPRRGQGRAATSWPGPWRGCDAGATRRGAVAAHPGGCRPPRTRLRAEGGRHTAGLGIADGTSLVLTVSRIAPQKDLATPRRLGPDRAPIWTGLSRARVTPTCSLVSAGGRGAAPVRFVGAIPDPGRMLLAADVFALTSRWGAGSGGQEADGGRDARRRPAVGGLPNCDRRSLHAVRRFERSPPGSMPLLGDGRCAPRCGARHSPATPASSSTATARRAMAADGPRPRRMLTYGWPRTPWRPLKAHLRDRRRRLLARQGPDCVPALGNLLRARGLRVTMQARPYLNVDPGTMNPSSTARSSSPGRRDRPRHRALRALPRRQPQTNAGTM